MLFRSPPVLVRVAGESGYVFYREEGQTLDPVEENEAGGVAARPLTIPYGLAIVAGCLVHVLIGAEGFPG